MIALSGRATESQALTELLGGIRTHSQVKVLLGEAGIGKTALLDALRAAATDCTVLGTTGVESELELAYAGLQQVCAPILSKRDTLPAPQRAALESAFGLSDAAPAPDRFLVGLAVVGLLAAASADRPVLVVVDDVQWLDTASAQTLCFVARRLLAEPVGLVLALRTPINGVEGLPTMVVRGLDDDSARALLESALPGRIDPAVRDRIVAEARETRWRSWPFPRTSASWTWRAGINAPTIGPSSPTSNGTIRRRLQIFPQTANASCCSPRPNPSAIRRC